MRATKLRSLPLLILCAVTGVVVLSRPTQGQVVDAAAMDARLTRALDSLRLPGLAVTIFSTDRTLYERGFGVADRATGRAVTPETLFQIGSATKTFTATLLGLLRERGAVQLDDPIARHLPPDVNLPVAANGALITVRHLASHTSGLPRQPPTLRRKHDDYPVLAFTHFELYQSLATSRLSAAPGERFDYSNFGFGVLGHVLERAAGFPYEVLLEREVFGPLGMVSSTVTLWPEFRPRLAEPYYRNRETGQLEDYTPWDMEALAPGGGITSSVRDLTRYLQFHMRVAGRNPRRPSLESLWEPQARVSDRQAYGFGWFITQVEGLGPVINHGGEVDGYTSYIGFVPGRGFGIALLTNTGGAPLGALAVALLRAPN